MENVAGLELGRLAGENSLVFSSLEFLFRFLPVFLAAFYLTPPKYRNVTLSVGSILLYACAQPRYVLLLVSVTALNYLIGIRAGTAARIRHRRRRQLAMLRWLFLAVAVDLGILVFFKAAGAAAGNLLLPLGLSFYTFKLVSYQADVYRARIDAETSFWRFTAYICMFPQITNGPIMRYEDAQEGLWGERILPEQLEEGLRLLVLGLASKVLLADRLGILWNDIRTIGFESISTPLAWLGAFAYSLQLYFDFQGYSLMAVGIGMMLGFPFKKNFDQPYSAVSVSDFWRRWHITLGSWFRDYVYIPLGGNREGTARLIGNLAFVWLLTGLWHGNGWNYVIWGLVLGSLVILEKLSYGSWLKRRKVLPHLYVLLVIPLTWMVFAITDLKELGVYFARLFPFFGVGQTLNEGDFGKYLFLYAPFLLAGAACCVPAVGRLYERWKKSWPVTFLLMLLFWAAVYRLSISSGNPFLYFSF